MADTSSLNEVAQAAAQVAVKGGMTITSARRSVAEQAHAMASNVIENAQWIAETYTSSPVKDACQNWVDEHSDESHDISQCAAGLNGVLSQFGDDDLRHLSWHMSGDAFDCEPDGNVAHLQLLHEIVAESQASGGEALLLTEEGGLTRWHVQIAGGAPPRGLGPAHAAGAATPAAGGAGGRGAAASASSPSTPGSPPTPPAGPATGSGPAPRGAQTPSPSSSPSSRSAPGSPALRSSAAPYLAPSGAPARRNSAPSGAPSSAGSSGTPSGAPSGAPAYPGRPVERESSGAAVRTWQQQLVGLGHEIEVDGIFGAGTEEATRRFQSSRGLTVDGVVGPRTWAAGWS